MQRVDLRALCEAVLAQHLDAALARHIDLGLEVQPVQIDGYEWLLRELLVNLVDNALRYSPANGTVTLRCGHPGGQAWLAVEDSGPGIAPDERSRVLERFYRLPGTTAEGSGLGLAIADEIARAHSAQLVLDTGPGGKGLRVSVLFTLA
jgi:two-component system sensor histidine kinase TctE